MDFRCIILHEFKSFFIAKDYNRRLYIIMKNKNLSARTKKGDDFYLYANKKKIAFINILTPISDFEAGVSA
ncbi:MAG: hypothetical protein ACLS2V_12570 [Clostridium paraputrificum]|uniref:hypothetical protein n=1 Tax=Clostridium sp. TaxID=1506 RepID=UPI0025B87CE3|nr:hypothetical protein [Clostridium sp.]MBS5926165.1 hypothetical protein [Clostridium sp.]